MNFRNGAQPPKHKYGDYTRRILDALHRRPSSSSEILYATGIPLDKVCSIMCFLVQSQRVICVGTQRNPATGLAVKIWKENPNRCTEHSQEKKVAAGVFAPAFSDQQLERCFPLGHLVPQPGRVKRIKFK